LDEGEDEVDILDQEELKRDRIRQLLSRYGVLFRELLVHETDLLSWRSLFRSLRLMELSGEVMSGHFFEGISGLQFITHEAFRLLTGGFDEDAIYWLNATDPASVCGIQLAELKEKWPSRRPSNFIVCHGRQIVLIAQKRGKQIEIRVAPDHPHLQDYFYFFKILIGREFNPMRYIVIEQLNGTPAGTSEYAKALMAFGFKKEHKSLELRRFI